MPHDLICLSHLHWDFVYQRPQHLRGRAAHDRRVYYVEDLMPGAQEAHLGVRREGNVTIVPHQLPAARAGHVAEA